MSHNVDKRGVKRGRCSQCADCEEYETQRDKVESNCLYCGHVAPEHGEFCLVLNYLLKFS